MHCPVDAIPDFHHRTPPITRSLGQNFLLDDGIQSRIASVAGLGPGDVVVEIGPGLGSLTKHLLASGAHVLAVEKDDNLYAQLLQRQDLEVGTGAKSLRLGCVAAAD